MSATMASGGAGSPDESAGAQAEVRLSVAKQEDIRWRTEDVLADKSFMDIGLPSNMVSALAACGYARPSPVQQAAIPLGRLGSDLIVQAKSGTGKTVVFATILLERVKHEESQVQALVVAPTREIAIQTEQVINRIAAALATPQAVKCAVFVGGLSVTEDEKRLRRLVHIAVGTPGRLMALIEGESLKCDRVAMLVLDEADVLLSDSFYADITWIYDQLPRRKQVMAFSATYTESLLADLEPLTKRPQRVMLCDETVSLKGVRQFYQLFGEGGGAADPSTANGAGTHQAGANTAAVSTASLDKAGLEEAKVSALLQLLGSCSFHQAAVFSNQKPWAVWLSRRLTAAGFPAVYLGGDVAQEERQRLMEDVRGFKTRVIVSTDVLARGVDLDRINLVVNMDLPRDAPTYVHRVGRTGRFGTRGVSVCMVTHAELVTLQSYLQEAQGGEVEPLPSGQLPQDLYAYELRSEWEKQALEQLQLAPVADQPPAPPAPALDSRDASTGAVVGPMPGQGAVSASQQGDAGTDGQSSAVAWQAYHDAWQQYYQQQSWDAWYGGQNAYPHAPEWYHQHHQQQQQHTAGSEWEASHAAAWANYLSATASTNPAHASTAWSPAQRQDTHERTATFIQPAGREDAQQEAGMGESEDASDEHLSDDDLDEHASRLLQGLAFTMPGTADTDTTLVGVGAGCGSESGLGRAVGMSGAVGGVNGGASGIAHDAAAPITGSTAQGLPCSTQRSAHKAAWQAWQASAACQPPASQGQAPAPRAHASYDKGSHEAVDNRGHDHAASNTWPSGYKPAHGWSHGYMPPHAHGPPMHPQPSHHSPHGFKPPVHASWAPFHAWDHSACHPSHPLYPPHHAAPYPPGHYHPTTSHFSCMAPGSWGFSPSFCPSCQHQQQQQYWIKYNRWLEEYQLWYSAFHDWQCRAGGMD